MTALFISILSLFHRSLFSPSFGFFLFIFSFRLRIGPVGSGANAQPQAVTDGESAIKIILKGLPSMPLPF